MLQELEYARKLLANDRAFQRRWASGERVRGRTRSDALKIVAAATSPANDAPEDVAEAIVSHFEELEEGSVARAAAAAMLARLVGEEEARRLLVLSD